MLLLFTLGHFKHGVSLYYKYILALIIEELRTISIFGHLQYTTGSRDKKTRESIEGF